MYNRTLRTVSKVPHWASRDKNRANLLRTHFFRLFLQKTKFSIRGLYPPVVICLIVYRNCLETRHHPPHVVR